MHCSHEKTNCKKKCFKIALIAIVGIAALGWLVMVLWNWLMPALFVGVHAVNYCQALGILLLSKILFGGFRGGCHAGRGWHRQRWESMTPEEREQMKSRWDGWCGSRSTNHDESNKDTISRSE